MSSGGGGSSTTTTGPPKYLQPYINQGLQGTQQQYQGGGTPVVPLSNETETALQGTAARARAGSDITRGANSLATQTLNGGFLGSNPYLDQTFNRAALQTQNQLASQFAGAGRNIGASEGLRSQQLNDLATGIYGGAYDAERNRQQQVLGMSGQLANQDYADMGQLAQVGATREGFAQEQANAPGAALDQYLARVNGNMGSTTITPQNRNRGAGALGGAMLGSQLAGSMGYGGWGQAAGAGLGGLVGGWG